MYVVFLNQHLIKNGQHSKTLSSHKWFKTTHKKQLRWENVLKYSISEIHKNQKYSFEEIVFLKKKLGMALKQEIIVWKNSQNLGWAPHFLEGPGKNVQTEWLPVLKPSNIISRFKKSTSYTVNGWETKNSWLFVKPISSIPKNRLIFVKHYCDNLVTIVFL